MREREREREAKKRNTKWLERDSDIKRGKQKRGNLLCGREREKDDANIKIMGNFFYYTESNFSSIFNVLHSRLPVDFLSFDAAINLLTTTKTTLIFF